MKQIFILNCKECPYYHIWTNCDGKTIYTCKKIVEEKHEFPEIENEEEIYEDCPLLEV